MKPASARVVLTGATGGIGRAAARALLDAGAAVMLVSRSPQRLAALEQALLEHALAAGSSDAARMACQVADVTEPAGVIALQTASERWQANVLVNNAGVPSFGRFDSLDADHLEQVLRTNLLAPMRLTQALLPALRRQQRAQIVQVGSVLGRLGLPGYAAYSASKFGLRGFTEALRRELAAGSVSVHYLGPRSTRTAFNDERVDTYNRATGTQMDTPQQVATALIDLLRSEAAESFLGFPERLAVRINGLAPTLLDGAFAEHRRQVTKLTDLARTTP